MMFQTETYKNQEVLTLKQQATEIETKIAVSSDETSKNQDVLTLKKQATEIETKIEVSSASSGRPFF